MPNARILVVLTVLLSVICGMAARAEEALPSQVGRLSAANGAVSLRPAGSEWTTAGINDPLATGMAVRTADRARAGIGIGALRSVLAGGSEAEIARLDDPTGEILREWTRPNGLRMRQVRVPLGVIGMIYEARPNVTVDAAALDALRRHPLAG